MTPKVIDFKVEKVDRPEADNGHAWGLCLILDNGKHAAVVVPSGLDIVAMGEALRGIGVDIKHAFTDTEELVSREEL